MMQGRFADSYGEHSSHDKRNYTKTGKHQYLFEHVYAEVEKSWTTHLASGYRVYVESSWSLLRGVWYL